MKKKMPVWNHMNMTGKSPITTVYMYDNSNCLAVRFTGSVKPCLCVMLTQCGEGGCPFDYRRVTYVIIAK